MGKRLYNRLTSVTVNAINKPGYYCDGHGLYLQVSSSGSKSWIFRFTLAGRTREMGLRAISTRTLAEARAKVKIYRQQLENGVDPIVEQQAMRNRNLAAQAQQRTFEQCAREYHTLHASGWKNVKHAAQWINSLAVYVFPLFGSKEISTVGKADILQALEPIWLSKTETASRIKQRIRVVLDWAAARDYRTEHNPHLWNQVAASLPKAKAVKKVEHFAACPYTDIFSVLRSIKNSSASDTVKLAAEFLVLTATRSGEVRGARWSEIDFRQRRWIIPAERMKAGREHRVPLADQALEILKTMQTIAGESDLIFPSKKGKLLSDMVFTELLRRLGFFFTMHGFRSAFRDWAAELTRFPREICELALAHSKQDETEAAYFRSDLFEKRRQLMQAWASYCTTERHAARIAAIGTTWKAS